MIKTIILILTLTQISSSFAGVGLYPALAAGMRFGNNSNTTAQKDKEELRAYGGVHVHLIKAVTFNKKSAIKLLGAGAHYSDKGELFYTVTPVSFQSDYHWQINLDFVYKARQTQGGNIGVSLGYGF